MTFLAGQVLPAEQLNTRMGTESVESNSSGFSSETDVASVTADLIGGRTYQVTFIGLFSSATAGDLAIARLYEDSNAGTKMTDSGLIYIDTTSGFGYPARMQALYTPASNETKTFVATGDLASGTGDILLRAASSRPTLLYVDYIPGST